MKITREQLKAKGLRLSTLETDKHETYVNDDFSIRIWKADTMEGWLLSVVNNYGKDLSEDAFAESEIRVSSGYVTEMSDIDDALKFCQKNWQDKD